MPSNEWRVESEIDPKIIVKNTESSKITKKMSDVWTAQRLFKIIMNYI